MPDFLPRRQVDMLSWSSNFRQRLVADWSEYGLTEAQSDHYAAVHAVFASLFREASEPATRSRWLVARKDAALATLKDEARKLARLVRAKPDITPGQLITLGLSPTHDNGPADVERLGAPTLVILTTIGRTVRIRLGNPAAATRLAKPAGVLGAAIYFAVGEQEPTSPDEWTFLRNTTRPATAVTFRPHLRPGTKVWLTASWLDARLRPGPCAPPRDTHLGYAASVPGSAQSTAA